MAVLILCPPCAAKYRGCTVLVYWLVLFSSYLGIASSFFYIFWLCLVLSLLSLQFASSFLSILRIHLFNFVFIFKMFYLKCPLLELLVVFSSCIGWIWYPSPTVMRNPMFLVFLFIACSSSSFPNFFFFSFCLYFLWNFLVLCFPLL